MRRYCESGPLHAARGVTIHKQRIQRIVSQQPVNFPNIQRLEETLVKRFMRTVLNRILDFLGAFDAPFFLFHFPLIF